MITCLFVGLFVSRSHKSFLARRTCAHSKAIIHCLDFRTNRCAHCCRDGGARDRCAADVCASAISRWPFSSPPPPPRLVRKPPPLLCLLPREARVGANRRKKAIRAREVHFISRTHSENLDGRVSGGRPYARMFRSRFARSAFWFMSFIRLLVPSSFIANR